MQNDEQFESSIKLRNLYKALRKCCKGTMWKDGTALYRSDGLENCVKLRRDFQCGTYKLQRYMHFQITRPKPRDITATRIRDRHGQRSACDNVLYPILTRSFIHDNGACQRNMGAEYTIKRVKRWMRHIYLKQRNERAKTLGCRPEVVGPFKVDGRIYNGDVRKYFPSSLHRNAKAIIRKAIDSPKLAAMFCAIVESFGESWWANRAMELGASEQAAQRAGRAITDARTEREYLSIRPEAQKTVILSKCDRQIRDAVVKLRLTPDCTKQMLRAARGDDARGIGLGSQMSQLVQLAQLSAIDHYAKEAAHVAVYMRYMDNFLVYDPRPGKDDEAVRGITDRLHGLGLQVNPKSQYVRLCDGFVFLGWHFMLTDTGKVIMRAAPGKAAEERRKLRRMARKATPESLQAHYNGWRAHMAQGDTQNLLKQMDAFFANLLQTMGENEKEGQT